MASLDSLLSSSTPFSVFQLLVTNPGLFGDKRILLFVLNVHVVVSSLFSLLFHCLSVGLPDLAARCLARLVTLQPAGIRGKDGHTESNALKMAQAAILEAHGDVEEALELYDEVIKADCMAVDAWKRKVVVWEQMNETDKAIEELNSFLGVFCNDESGWQHLERLYSGQRKYELAKFCVEELLTIAPENFVYHLQFADLVFSANGPCALARNYYAQALELAPACLRALYGLVLCDDGQNDLAKLARKKLKEMYSEKAPHLLEIVVPSLSNRIK